jgi:hypothetical protein
MKFDNYKEFLEMRDVIARKRDKAKICLDQIYDEEMKVIFDSLDELRDKCRHSNEKEEFTSNGNHRFCPDCGKESWTGTYKLSDYNELKTHLLPFKEDMKMFLKRKDLL